MKKKLDVEGILEVGMGILEIGLDILEIDTGIQEVEVCILEGGCYWTISWISQTLV